MNHRKIALGVALAAALSACSSSSFDARFRLMTAPDTRMPLTAGDIDAALRQFADGDDRPIVLFVHGRGDEPQKSIARNALASIEAHHDVRVLMFTWDSHCLVCRPVDRAAAAAPDLAQLLAAVADARRNGAAPDNKLILLTHSMGSIVLERAVTDGRFGELPDRMFDSIVLAASDSDADGHADWLRRASRLAPATYVMVNPRDWILSLSGRNLRVGNRVPSGRNGDHAEWPVRYVVAASENFTLHRLFNNGKLDGCARLKPIVDAAIKGDPVPLEDAGDVERAADNVFVVSCAS